MSPAQYSENYCQANSFLKTSNTYSFDSLPTIFVSHGITNYTNKTVVIKKTRGPHNRGENQHITQFDQYRKPYP